MNAQKHGFHSQASLARRNAAADAMAAQLCQDDPGLAPNVAREIAASLVMLDDISRIASETLRIVQECGTSAHSMVTDNESATLTALHQLCRLQPHEKRAASKLRTALKRS